VLNLNKRVLTFLESHPDFTLKGDLAVGIERGLDTTRTALNVSCLKKRLSGITCKSDNKARWAYSGFLANKKTLTVYSHFALDEYCIEKEIISFSKQGH